jgi:predicted O-methyltransferase YrrM
VKAWLKRRLGERWRWRVHKLSRLRWLTKARIISSYGLSPSRHLRYILLDPEVESYSYRVANLEGMLATISEATGVPTALLHRYAAEPDADPELRGALTRRLRWRFDVKHRPELANRLGWYVLIRALRPGLVVETGIYQGLGSLALLSALEHNQGDGSPGELMSFDLSEDAGSFVDRSRHPDWKLILGSTTETLQPAVSGRKVGALFQDSDHSEQVQRLEFGAALANMASTLVLVDASGGQSPVLEELSRELGGDYRRVRLGAADHWYQHGELTFSVFREGPRD